MQCSKHTLGMKIPAASKRADRMLAAQVLACSQASKPGVGTMQLAVWRQTRSVPCWVACPIPELRLGGWSWVDASRDDIQVNAAASNGGGDSQRAGSIGEARARRGAGADAGLAGCKMHARKDMQRSVCTVRYKNTCTTIQFTANTAQYSTGQDRTGHRKSSRCRKATVAQ